MNAAMTQVLDEMILGEQAKALLVGMGAEAIGKLCLVFKLLGGSKMLSEYEKPIADSMAPTMNLVRMALAQCDVSLRRQEEIVNAACHRVAVIFVGYIDKLCKGEPIDEDHAELIRGQEKVEAAGTMGDKCARRHA